MNSAESPQSLVLAAATTPGAATVTGGFSMEIGGDALAITVTLPAGPTTMAPLLPVFHGLSDALVARSEANSVAAGKPISCRIGCGTCCRQAVPISPAEARGIAATVAAMPAPRRDVVMARFDVARATLDAAGIDRTPETFLAIDPRGRGAISEAYLEQRIACPLLENESCSIYPDRPLVCREYLVTSPAANCDEPTIDAIDKVDVPGLSYAFIATDAKLEGTGRLLLVDALAWAAANPAPPAAVEAPQLLMAVIETMAYSANG